MTVGLYNGAGRRLFAVDPILTVLLLSLRFPARAYGRVYRRRPPEKEVGGGAVQSSARIRARPSRAREEAGRYATAIAVVAMTLTSFRRAMQRCS
jgi:hypothetical protein